MRTLADRFTASLLRRIGVSPSPVAPERLDDVDLLRDCSSPSPPPHPCCGCADVRVIGCDGKAWAECFECGVAGPTVLKRGRVWPDDAEVIAAWNRWIARCDDPDLTFTSLAYLAARTERPLWPEVR